MRFEHKLSPSVAAFAQQTVEAMQELRRRYLTLLGQAKESELEAQSLQKALERQLEIEAQTGALPPARGGYKLSPDNTALIGEVDAPPAEPEIEVLESHPNILEPRMLNGSGEVGEYGR